MSSVEGKCHTGKGRRHLEIRSIERVFMVKGGASSIVGRINIEINNNLLESPVLRTRYSAILNSGNRNLTSYKETSQNAPTLWQSNTGVIIIIIPK